jgi:hypothetical protein
MINQALEIVTQNGGYIARINCPGSESYRIFKTFPVFTNSKRSEHSGFCTVCSSDVNVSLGGNHGLLKHASGKKQDYGSWQNCKIQTTKLLWQ